MKKQIEELAREIRWRAKGHIDLGEVEAFLEKAITEKYTLSTHRQDLMDEINEINRRSDRWKFQKEYENRYVPVKIEGDETRKSFIHFTEGGRGMGKTDYIRRLLEAQEQGPEVFPHHSFHKRSEEFNYLVSPELLDKIRAAEKEYPSRQTGMRVFNENPEEE